MLPETAWPPWVVEPSRANLGNAISCRHPYRRVLPSGTDADQYRPHPDDLLAKDLFVARAALLEEVFFLGTCFSEGVFLVLAFLPAFLETDFLLVADFFSEAASLAVVFFFAWRVALPEAPADLLTAVERLCVFFLVRTARRPRPAGAKTSSADASSMSMPKTDDSSSDSSTLPLRGLPPDGG